MKEVEKSKWIGNWAGKYVRCPLCGAELLENRIGIRWCSFIMCRYKEVIKST